MIDVDQHLAVQAAQPCALHTVALQQDGGVEAAIDFGSMHHATRARQIAVDGRHTVAQHHLRALAQCFDNEGAA